MHINKREIGWSKEAIAGEYLEQKGYHIIEKNYCIRGGEIDLIAEDEQYLVFVEVKYRKNDFYGDPLYAITKKKQYLLSRCAATFLKKREVPTDFPVRFDVITIVGESITHIENAFGFFYSF